jgi:E3 ubiquitin-protein ligase NRDP1
LDGVFMGKAFEDEQLKSGPIWAAISLLHIAGCTLVTDLEVPEYFN